MTNEERQAKEKRLKELDALRWQMSMQERVRGRIFIGSPKWYQIASEYQKLYDGLRT